MEPVTAWQILSALADGRNPLTGETLAADDVCQQPQVVRALCLAVQHLPQPKSSDPSKGASLKNAGKPWTAAEEAELVKEFEAGTKINQLALKHGRTEQAIHGRLYRLGKMPPWPLAAPRTARNP
jgi:hypothetical protein